MPVVAVTDERGGQVTDRDTPALLRLADSLRDAGDTVNAALQYHKAHESSSERDDILVQLGNMRKDSGDTVGADSAYRAALARCKRADTYLQYGHLLKLTGDRLAALSAYRAALDLDPELPGAIQELAEAGDSLQQRRRFAAQMQAGGVEALLTVSQRLTEIRGQLDQLARLLPDALARVAFPVAAYDSFRQAFPVPLAPAAPRAEIHIVLLAEREPVAVLFRQIAAIQAQTSGSWRLSVLGQSEDRKRTAELAALSDRRIEWVPGAGDAMAEHRHCADVDAPLLLLLAEGAVLDPQAIGWFQTAASWSEAAAFVCDEETATPVGSYLGRSAPILRGAVDYDSLLAFNTAGETVAVRVAALRELLPSLPSGSVTQSRVAMLLSLARAGRVGHIPHCLVWRHGSRLPGEHDHAAGVDVHLATCQLTERIDRLPGGGLLWRATQPDAALTVMIPTRNNAGDVRGMVESLRNNADRPRALEVIVIDNGSTRPADLAALDDLAAEPQTRLLRSEGPFNWSQLNNMAVSQSSAPLLLFANDDMRMVTPAWDLRLRSLLERADVGAVGARLLYDDDTIQHAGILMGWRGSVIHDGLHEPAEAPGPGMRWALTRAAGAVTGAFLAITRQNFDSVGGFDAQALPVAYSDVDLALKLRARGLKIIWTPSITLYHQESRTRGQDHADPWKAARNEQERAVMAARWGSVMNVEPSASPLWQDASLPFRLMAAPSMVRVKEYVTLAGSSNPWLVHRRDNHPGSDAAPVPARISRYSSTRS